MSQLIMPGNQNRPLNFGEYKTQIKVLKEEQIELVKALADTTALMEEANKIIDTLRSALLGYMPGEEIDALFVDKDAG